MDRDQLTLTRRQALAVDGQMLGHEGRVLSTVAGRRQSDDPRAGELGEAARERRMIRVSVSDDNPPGAKDTHFSATSCDLASGESSILIKFFRWVGGWTHAHRRHPRFRAYSASQ